MKFHELACSYISFHHSCRSMSLHAVPWAYMKFYELAFSSLNLHEVPWACKQFHELACSFISLYAVPFFVWAAHKNFAVLVVKEFVSRVPLELSGGSWKGIRPQNSGNIHRHLIDLNKIYAVKEHTLCIFCARSVHTQCLLAILSECSLINFLVPSVHALCMLCACSAVQTLCTLCARAHALFFLKKY